MLAGFFAWWLARIIELLPTAWTKATPIPGDGLVVETNDSRGVTLSIRQKGRYSPISLGVAARQAGRKPVLLRPPPGVVLVKHAIPTVPRATHRTAETFMVRGLAGACAALAAVALVLPFGLQAFALYKTESAIAELRPTLAQVERLRREIASGDAERGILTRELERTGAVLQTLATVTRILPDDTFLTDFSLRGDR